MKKLILKRKNMTLQFKEIHTKTIPEPSSVCECGNRLGYVATDEVTVERRMCVKCGRLHYVDDRPNFRLAFGQRGGK